MSPQLTLSAAISGATFAVFAVATTLQQFIQAPELSTGLPSLVQVVSSF